jgi:mRNA interferase YafQ
MYTVDHTNKFAKDYKICKKRGYIMPLLDKVILLLEENGELPAKYKSHKLSGDYKDNWECHILSDWLLLWLKNSITRQIVLVRTGTHSDLF